MNINKDAILRTIGELSTARAEYMQKSRDFEHLTLTAKNYYHQAKVYEYLIECLKKEL